MKLLALILALQLILNIGCSNRQTNSDATGKEIVLRLEPKTDNPRNSEGDFIKLNDGKILFIYTKFTGGSADHANAFLASRISYDNGQTWSTEDETIVSNEGTMNVMSVSLLRLSDQKLALFYLRKNSTADCIPYMRVSTDEARTWSDPIRCIADTGYYVLNNSRVVKLNDGRLIMPVALHKQTEKGITRKAEIMCYYSNDEGKNWLKSKAVENPLNIILQEPGIIELRDGRVMLFCRTDAGVQYLSYSNDKCLNWTPAEPGNITSPLSPASIKRIPETGDLLLVWNNNGESGSNKGKRTPYNLALSKDEGKTWVNLKTIEDDPDGWYCYTAIEFINDHVLLGHCAGNRKKHNGLETNQITKLSLDWIYHIDN